VSLSRYGANRTRTASRCASVSGGQVATVARTWARCSGVSLSVRRFGVSVILPRGDGEDAPLAGHTL